MVERKNVISDESLEVLVLIKFQIVKSVSLIKNKKISDKDVQVETTNAAKLIALFQMINSDLSYEDTIKLMTEWINENKLLTEKVENLLNEKTFINIKDIGSMDSRDINEIHDILIKAVNQDISQHSLDYMIKVAEGLEKGKS